MSPATLNLSNLLGAEAAPSAMPPAGAPMHMGVDPMLQMSRQVATLRAGNGQSGPEDMVPLLARFAQALGSSGIDVLAGLEYREGRLKVRFQPQRVDGRAAREQLREQCTRAGLKLQFDNEREPTASIGLQT